MRKRKQRNPITNEHAKRGKEEKTIRNEYTNIIVAHYYCQLYSISHQDLFIFFNLKLFKKYNIYDNQKYLS